MDRRAENHWQVLTVQVVGLENSSIGIHVCSVPMFPSRLGLNSPPHSSSENRVEKEQNLLSKNEVQVMAVEYNEMLLYY